jgi:hypothetical protein
MQYRDSQGGAQYPRSLGEFQSWFATDADCLDYLEWLRWPDGSSAHDVKMTMVRAGQAASCCRRL